MSSLGCFINGNWMPAHGLAFAAIDPTTGEESWSGKAADHRDIEAAVNAARDAAEDWAQKPFSERADHLNAFGEQLKSARSDFVAAICRSTGKPRWEAGTEVDAMLGKIPLSLRAEQERRAPVVVEAAGVVSATRYKPHGVVAVLGPFNFPGHLPNGHILPALLAGNTVIYKPSEQAPLVGQAYAHLWERAGLSAGVFNMVQGGRDTGQMLSTHPGIDGLFFTGSSRPDVRWHKLTSRTRARSWRWRWGEQSASRS